MPPPRQLLGRPSKQSVRLQLKKLDKTIKRSDAPTLELLLRRLVFLQHLHQYAAVAALAADIAAGKFGPVTKDVLLQLYGPTAETFTLRPYQCPAAVRAALTAYAAPALTCSDADSERRQAIAQLAAEAVRRCHWDLAQKTALFLRPAVRPGTEAAARPYFAYIVATGRWAKVLADGNDLTAPVLFEMAFRFARDTLELTSAALPAAGGAEKAQRPDRYAISDTRQLIAVLAVLVN